MRKRILGWLWMVVQATLTSLDSPVSPDHCCDLHRKVHKILSSQKLTGVGYSEEFRLISAGYTGESGLPSFAYTGESQSNLQGLQMLLKEQFIIKQTMSVKFWLLGVDSCLDNFSDLSHSDRLPCVAYTREFT